MPALTHKKPQQIYNLPYQLLVSLKANIGRKIFRFKQWEMDHATDYLVNNMNGGMILDLGCSTGYFTRYLSEQFGAERVEGADISLSSIMRNNELFDPIKFHHIHNGFYKEHGQQYSAITLMHVLEHVENPVPFLKNIITLLEKDGILVICVPQERVRGDAAVFENMYNLIRGNFQNVHLRRYNYDSLAADLEKAGLSILEHNYCNMIYQNSNRKCFSNHSLTFYTKAIR